MTPTEKSEQEKPVTSRLGSVSTDAMPIKFQWGPEYFYLPKRILVGLLRASGGRMVWDRHDEVLLNDEDIQVYVEDFDMRTVIRLEER